MGILAWLCCPIGNSLQTTFVEDSLLDGDDGPRALQHQSPADADGLAPRSAAHEQEEQCTASLLASETRPSNGAPTHRRTTSSSSKLSLPKEVRAAVQ